MASVAEPDIAGFIEAQANLRAQGGAPVTFRVPVKPVWPGGTKLDPISGLPYDATVKPTSVAYEDVVKTCLVILKQGSPLRPQSDTAITAVGEMSGMDVIADIAASDYEEVLHASHMRINALEYEIREAKPFSLGGVVYRFLLYGDER